MSLLQRALTGIPLRCVVASNNHAQQVESLLRVRGHGGPF